MWNINRNANRNDKGMTLVELLVALAVSAILLTGLSYILFSVLKFYGRANANVEIQNESQTSLNLVIDSILSAKGVCFVEKDASLIDPATDEMTCALFGELDLDDTGTKSMSFTGDAVLWQPKCQEMYLMSGTFDLGTFSDEASAPLEAIAAMKGKLPTEADARLPYLMAKNVTAFELEALDSCFLDPISLEDAETEEEKKKVGKYYFKNPMTIHINMEFTYEYESGKVITRQMDDNASVRNRLNYAYIQRTGSGMIKYLRDQG